MEHSKNTVTIMGNLSSIIALAVLHANGHARVDNKNLVKLMLKVPILVCKHMIEDLNATFDCSVDDPLIK